MVEVLEMKGNRPLARRGGGGGRIVGNRGR